MTCRMSKRKPVRAHFSKAQRSAIAENADWRCAGCTRDVDRYEKWTADHILPVALGGPNTVENGQLLCPQCDGVKTSGQDIPQIAKMKRQREHQEEHERVLAGGKRLNAKDRAREKMDSKRLFETGIERQE